VDIREEIRMTGINRNAKEISIGRNDWKPNVEAALSV
jgi:hypothetical protein